MTASSPLPAEIVDLIVSEHSNNPKDLRAFSLVSRSWRYPSQRYLFRSLLIEGSEIDAFAERCEKQDSPFSPRIVQEMTLIRPFISSQIISLVFGINTEDEFGLEARSIILGVQKLVLKDVTFEDWPADSLVPEWCGLLKKFTRLRDLQLVNVQFCEMIRLPNMLQSMDSLESLSWRNPTLEVYTQRTTRRPIPPDIMPFPYQLHIVCIDVRHIDIGDPTISCFIRNLAVRRVKEWEFTGMYSKQHAASLNSFMSSASCATHKQKWTLMSRPFLDKLVSKAFRSQNVWKNRKITHLALKGNWWIALAGFMDGFQATMDRHSLEYLTLPPIPIGEGGSLIRRRLRRLDSLMDEFHEQENSPFKAIRCTVNAGYSQMGLFRYYMPRLNYKNLLVAA
ncbi:hypothetical protein VNI00_008166 [Paramarasmius palmivorus]|uniref:F-box domain-containing protein n=1 Tax=Paramarasmius palmivorus TaxID=297713 RepID=A0AAW0CV67_9AGAR